MKTEKWEVVEHSWSDTSIMSGNETICSKSIYDDATEENQEELEDWVSANFKLMVLAPEMLLALENCLKRLNLSESLSDESYAKTIEKLIKKAKS